jgi:hypothetical protein
MPSLNTSSGSSDGGWGIPYKAIVLVVLIGASGYYVWYQYERLHPSPHKSNKAIAAKKAEAKNHKNDFADDVQNLNLTDDQKKQISAIDAETTDPQVARRKKWRVLTKEQRQEFQNSRREANASRQLNRKKREEKIKRYFPGGDLDFAKAANQRVREQTKARREAQNNASPNTATK